jgi:hypothetical protein
MCPPIACSDGVRCEQDVLYHHGSSPARLLVGDLLVVMYTASTSVTLSVPWGSLQLPVPTYRVPSTTPLLPSKEWVSRWTAMRL